MPASAPLWSCVVFDMDGTLTRTNQLIFESFNHVARRYAGTTLTPAEIISLFGPPEEGGLAQVVGRDRVASAMDDLCAYYRSNHRRLAQMHGGIDRVLAYLRSRGVLLALFTGKGRRTTAITLDEFGLTGSFDLVVTGTDVENHKPHPEGIARILRSLRVPPTETLMVGDTLADVRAAHGAGVAMAAVLWDSFDRERVLRARPEYVFHAVKELEAWFRHTLN